MIVTLDQVKSHLQITGNAEDAYLTFLIKQSESAIENYIKRQIAEREVTEFADGSGANIIWLRKTPVQSIVSLNEDANGFFGEGEDAFASATLLTPGKDYTLQCDQPVIAGGIRSMSGGVLRIGKTWKRPQADIGLLNTAPGVSMGSIRIEYIAGWPAEQIPADLTGAMLQMITQLRSIRVSGNPMQQESMDYYSYTNFNPVDLKKAIGSVEWLLNPYRRIVL